MKNRIILFLSYLFIAIITQSCDDDDWNFDIPGCMNQTAINYDVNASTDNGSCYFGTEIFVYDIITLLSSLGGTLGLLLGLSILSIVLGCLEYVQTHLNICM